MTNQTREYLPAHIPTGTILIDTLGRRYTASQTACVDEWGEPLVILIEEDGACNEIKWSSAELTRAGYVVADAGKKEANKE